MLLPLISLWIIMSLWLLLGACNVQKRGRLSNFNKDATVPLRGLMALFVVLGHLVSQGVCSISAVKAISWARPAVGTFLFLSGYGMMKKANGSNSDYVRSLLPKTFTKLFFPLGCIMGVKALYMLTIGTFDIQSIICAYSQGRTCLCEHSWYVFELFLLCCCFYATNIILKKQFWILILFACATIIHCLLRFTLQWQNWWWVHIFAFPVGCLFAQQEKLITKHLLCFKGFFFFPLFLAWTALVASRFLWRGYGSEVVFSSLIGGFVAICAMSAPLPKVWPLSLLGVCSYEIYLTHGELRDTLVKRLTMIDSNYVALLLLFLSVVVGYFFKRCMDYVRHSQHVRTMSCQKYQ